MSLKRRADRMYATVEAKHQNAWIFFGEEFLSHLSLRDRRLIKRGLEGELRRCCADRMAALMGAFGADAEEWWEWYCELTTVKYDEGVSFWPSDAPEPPPEPEGLWEHLQQQKKEDPRELEEKAVVGCILMLSLARARREYEELHESQ